jgi:hypothetical protein
VSAAETRYLLARVEIPVSESLDAFADRLTRLIPGFTFEEEMTGRYEEVPAFVAEHNGMEFVLFGVPKGEANDELVLEFECTTNLPIESLMTCDAGGFVRQFVSEKPLESGAFMDFSEELAQLLVKHGIEGCKPIRPVVR